MIFDFWVSATVSDLHKMPAVKAKTTLSSTDDSLTTSWYKIFNITVLFIFSLVFFKSILRVFLSLGSYALSRRHYIHSGVKLPIQVFRTCLYNIILNQVWFLYILWDTGSCYRTPHLPIIRSIDPADQWKVGLIRKLPLRPLSRLWGWLCGLNLPIWLRHYVIGLYIWVFKCNLYEAQEEDITQYRNLASFFRRKLKPYCRPINYQYDMTSPVDGSVVRCGVVQDGMIEQIKGISYSVRTFLGSGLADKFISSSSLCYESSTALHYCVIYLAPGDYHRFHAPTECSFDFRRHFPGELISVGPAWQRMVKGLFTYNERVVLSGHWKHGFFSLVAVGAYNVGSIYLNCDKELHTNHPSHKLHRVHYDRCLTSECKDGVHYHQGDSIGGFNLGSTVALVFEAPKDFQFYVSPGMKLKFGEPVGRCECSS